MMSPYLARVRHEHGRTTFTLGTDAEKLMGDLLTEMLKDARLRDSMGDVLEAFAQMLHAQATRPPGGAP